MNNIYDEILIALHSVWNRRWLALAVAWGICLVGWLVVALIPNSYESSARIFVQMQSILPGKIGITPSEIGRASCRDGGVSRCRSRWSQYHQKKKEANHL